MRLLEKTKIGSAQKHAALRPNPLETPAGHKVFVKRRCNFAPARRHPVDQLDGGRQLDPEGSREKKEFKIGPIRPVPPPNHPSASDFGDRNGTDSSGTPCDVLIMYGPRIAVLQSGICA